MSSNLATKRSPKNNPIIRNWINYDYIELGYKKAKGRRNCGNCDAGSTGRCKVFQKMGIESELPFNKEFICWKYTDLLQEIEQQQQPEIRPEIIIPMAQNPPESQATSHTRSNKKRKEKGSYNSRKAEQLDFLEILV